MHALIVGNGTAPARLGLDAAWPGWDRDVRLVVAADGGARAAAALGLPIHLVVGDADSIDPRSLGRLAAAGVHVERWSTEKDASDMELAVAAAWERGASRLTLLAALRGARLDHELANLALLDLPALAGRDAQLLDERSRVQLRRGPAELLLPGRIGDLISLLPVGGAAAGVTTSGLRFPLRGETLDRGSSRGLSNVRIATDASLTLDDGHLFVIETPSHAAGIADVPLPADHETGARR